jgi:hypothetical protein
VSRVNRFSSPDPIGGSIADPQSLNAYPYTRNDPINLTDPTGLWIGGGPSPVDPFGGGPSLPWTPWEKFARGNSICTNWGLDDFNLPDIECSDFGPAMHPLDGGVGGKRVFLAKARTLIANILTGDNDCSKFFNNSSDLDLSDSYGDFAQETAAHAFLSDDIRPEPLGSPLVGASTTQGGGDRSMIFVNSAGFMLNSAGFIGAQPVTLPGLGPFAPNTVGTQIVGLLHEFAHTLDLIPRDQGNVSQSVRNTKTILDNCLTAILAAIKVGS